MKTHFLSKLAFALLLLSVAGCGILQRQSDPTRHYVLNSTSSAKLTSASGLTVVVGPVTVPGYLSHDGIVTQGSQNDLKIAPFHVWGESLEKGVTRVVAEDLSTLLDTPTVIPFPDADARYDYRVAIIIRRFEMAADGQVRLNASYSIVRKPGTTADGSARSRAYAATVADPEDYSSIVDAMSQTLTNLSKSIGRDLLALKNSQ